jgi:long-chain fatty acid transport protein
LVAALGASLWGAEAYAAGFELPENTAKSVGSGGVGAAMKRDPSAIYFNPALLTRAKGYQLQIDANLSSISLEFQRDPLSYQLGQRRVVQQFEPVRNEAGVFPAPFFATSWDLGTEDLVVGFGLFGPPAYGRTCYGELTSDGQCEVIPDGAARHMLVESNLLQVYAMLSAAYRFKVAGGDLSIGVSAGPAYQRNSFKLVIDADVNVAPPWREDPQNESVFEARDLEGWAFTGTLGVAWNKDGLHFGASYRPPISWEGRGVAVASFPEQLEQLSAPRLTDDGVTLRTQQAGQLRAGVGWAQGTHPGFEDRPRLELEANIVWEDWSRVDFFEVETAGDLALTALEGSDPLKLETIYQRKGWRDTVSMRLGASWGAWDWLTVRTGGYMETGAQQSTVTNVDFVSWDRRAVGLGATVHIGQWLDLDLGYMSIFSPDRQVTGGEVYNSIPLSQCTGPNYDSERCSPRGRPPGNVLNNGLWSTHAHIASVGLTLRVD